MQNEISFLSFDDKSVKAIFFSHGGYGSLLTHIHLNWSSFFKKPKCVASGILTGGNLSVIQSLRGTPLDISPKGKILFIEDIDEHYYHIDRMMLNLKTGHILEQLSGLIVGYFTGIKDGDTPFGKTACEIIKGAVATYRYPVVFGFQSGHELPNYPIIMGSRISLDVSDEKVLLKY